MSGGCTKGSRCQWWSRLFSIGQLVWEEDGSLSKTTKLLLLDSLLQEVCIESGSDGSLALSSLGLSVCLVSHNLLYSGLKKAHLKQWNCSKWAIICQMLFFHQQTQLGIWPRCPILCQGIWGLHELMSETGDIRDILLNLMKKSVIG